MIAVAKNRDTFVETEVDDETVLMRLSDGDFFSLEGTGRAIWQAIDGTRTPADVATALTETFDAPLDVLQADVEQFVAVLADAGLVTA